MGVGRAQKLVILFHTFFMGVVKALNLGKVSKDIKFPSHFVGMFRSEHSAYLTDNFRSDVRSDMIFE